MCTKCKGAIVGLWHGAMAYCVDCGVWQSAYFVDSFDDDDGI